jgi:glyoxylase-like metal-dependent hydrolase (beta-lactamase superfamily II)
MAKYQRRLGDIRIHRIVELTEAELAPRIIFPETGPEDWDRHQAWMPPRAMDPSSGNLIVVFQAFLLQTSHHNILVDACVGDNKPREDNPNWHLQQRGTFLPLLAQAGVTPEAVNYVMCTHMHSDHVGWNTELRDGRWVPTFPNAEYIFFAQGAGCLGSLAQDDAAAAHDGQRVPNP